MFGRDYRRAVVCCLLLLPAILIVLACYSGAPVDAYLARSKGAAFIQIMEPRAVGHYKGRDVLLSANELGTLEAFSDWMNFDPANASGPIVTYPALYQRRHGCLGAAERYLYLDTNGDAHACPFCRHSRGNVVRDGIDAAVRDLRERGCPAAAPT